MYDGECRPPKNPTNIEIFIRRLEKQPRGGGQASANKNYVIHQGLMHHKMAFTNSDMYRVSETRYMSASTTIFHNSFRRSDSRGVWIFR